MAKEVKTLETPFTIFMNPKIVKQLENGPKITAVGQVILYKTKEGKWGTDAVEIVDTEEIEFLVVWYDVPFSNITRLRGKHISNSDLRILFRAAKADEESESGKGRQVLK